MLVGGLAICMRGSVCVQRSASVYVGVSVFFACSSVNKRVYALIKLLFQWLAMVDCQQFIIGLRNVVHEQKTSNVLLVLAKTKACVIGSKYRRITTDLHEYE